MSDIDYTNKLRPEEFADFTFTQQGQLRPYADSVYAGTVKAKDETDARDKLRRYRWNRSPLKNAQDKREWWEDSVESFRDMGNGTFSFRIISPYKD